MGGGFKVDCERGNLVKEAPRTVNSERFGVDAMRALQPTRSKLRK
jgi:hypothetical protein